MMDGDSNLCTFGRGIHHVEEASTHTQVTGSTAKPGIGSDFGYFHVREESIPGRTTALRVHSFLFTPRRAFSEPLARDLTTQDSCFPRLLILGRGLPFPFCHILSERHE